MATATITVNNVNYAVYNTGLYAFITGNNSANIGNIPAISVTIPPTVSYNSQTYTVRQVATNALTVSTGRVSGWSLPNTITSYGLGCFNNTSSLKSVNIADGGTPATFGTNVFPGTVTSVTFGVVGTSLPNNMFNGNTSIKTIAFGTGTTLLSIPGSFCSGCSGLTSFTIPSSVISIASNAFNNCTTLPTITFPTSLKSFGI